jgi:hypothetical protein
MLILDQDQITASELGMSFHDVKHQHSYFSQDWENKLITKEISDSEIGNKYKCGCTKSEF